MLAGPACRREPHRPPIAPTWRRTRPHILDMSAATAKNDKNDKEAACLLSLIQNWAKMPPNIKAAIMALVGTGW